MAKIPSKSDVVEAIAFEPKEVDRIQPVLKLSDLSKTSEVMKVLPAQQAMVEQVRSTLQLPYLEALAMRPSATRRAVASQRAMAPPSSDPMHRDAHSVAIASARDLGRIVRTERVKRKLSQQAFADLVGVGRRFISELENGKASLEFDRVMQVALASGIDVPARRRR